MSTNGRRGAAPIAPATASSRPTLQRRPEQDDGDRAAARRERRLAADAGDAAPEADDLAGTGLTIDARVRHARWGDGVVQHGDPEKVTVAFHAAGYKTLALEVLRERRDVLRPAE